MSLKDRNRAGNLGQPAPTKTGAGAVKPVRRAAVAPLVRISTRMPVSVRERMRAAYIQELGTLTPDPSSPLLAEWIDGVLREHAERGPRARARAGETLPALEEGEAREKQFVRVDGDLVKRIDAERARDWSTAARSLTRTDWIIEAIRVRAGALEEQHGKPLPPAPDQLPRRGRQVRARGVITR